MSRSRRMSGRTLDAEAVSSVCLCCGLGCAGDCSRNFVVSIDELILSVSIALGERPATECSAVDWDSSGTVEINELVTAVGRALTGCGP